jgi:p-hydroxybenzoate 3-monooxygenase
MNGIVIHNVEDVQLHDLLSANPHVTYRTGDEVARIDCDYIIGADGFHGVSRKSIPQDSTERIRKGLSLRLAGCPVPYQAGFSGIGLCQA